MVEWNIVRDYVFMKGELYRRMPEGILSRFVGYEEAKWKLEEVHSKTCRFCREISLYCILKKGGFYWLDMNKEANQVQSRYKACQHAIDREESYAVFTVED